MVLARVDIWITNCVGVELAEALLGAFRRASSDILDATDFMLFLTYETVSN